jgi:3-hydroxy-D-aspartate aldolase
MLRGGFRGDPPAKVGAPIDTVDTPALLVDLDALERNIARMAAFAAERNIRLRPHGKTHKSVAIAELQLRAGAVGICCQKVSEAEAFVAGGIEDVLVTNEVITPSKLRRLAVLTKAAHIGVCVDHAVGVERLAEAASTAERAIDVYLEIDVGGGRCGVERIEDGLRLADLVTQSRNLRFAGIQAYHGRAQHIRKPGDRKVVVDLALKLVAELRESLVGHGLGGPFVTGAGTGTFHLETASGLYDEIQPGSYVFMDRDYADNIWDPNIEPFEHSLCLIATVVSRHESHAVVDAGLKSHSMDSGMPRVAGRPNLVYIRPSDEHGLIVPARESTSLPKLGEMVRLVPGHCDPTISCHDWLVAVRANWHRRLLVVDRSPRRFVIGDAALEYPTTEKVLDSPADHFHHGAVVMSRCRLIKGGANEFLTKPFLDQDLLECDPIGLARDCVWRSNSPLRVVIPPQLWQTPCSSSLLPSPL